MAVLAIEWRISQHLKELNATTWDQLMDHFLKVCKQFAAVLVLYSWHVLG